MAIDFTEKAKRYQAIEELCEKYAACYAKNRLWGETQKIIKDKKNPGREAPKIWDVSSSGIFLFIRFELTRF